VAVCLFFTDGFFYFSIVFCKNCFMSVPEIRTIHSKEELQTAFAIRYRVFVEEQGVPASEELDEHEDKSRHFLVLEEGVPVATARWRVTSEGVKLERFAVLPEHRNRGIGAQLVQAVLDDVRRQHPDKKIYLHAQLPARRLYERAGFVPEGDIFDECGILHIKMYWKGE
jgi:predicted GNAT family N-acyltransferase